MHDRVERRRRRAGQAHEQPAQVGPTLRYAGGGGGRRRPAPRPPPPRRAQVLAQGVISIGAGTRAPRRPAAAEVEPLLGSERVYKGDGPVAQALGRLIGSPGQVVALLGRDLAGDGEAGPYGRVFTAARSSRCLRNWPRTAGWSSRPGRTIKAASGECNVPCVEHPVLFGAVGREALLSNPFFESKPCACDIFMTKDVARTAQEASTPT